MIFFPNKDFLFILLCFFFIHFSYTDLEGQRPKQV